MGNAQHPHAKKPVAVPEKASLDGLDGRVRERWESADVFAFKKPTDGREVFSIDTPPPTVSGNLHAGSAFGFTHQDAIARYQRMAGRAVFFPIGWDDNGLPTERRVENYYGVRCDPSLAFDPGFTPPEKPDPKRKVAVSRPNFIALCEELTGEDEKVFEELYRRLGISVDWNFVYTTIGEHARRTSQYAFLQNLARGEAYQSEAPTAWDVSFQTAVAQAEFEEREVDGAYHTLAFTLTGTDEVIKVDTTRPELLPACVALIAHPDDERYKPLFGKTVKTPVFGAEVKICAHKDASPEKGTGIAMCCTFGDSTDVVWWRELNLPIKAVMGRDGRFVEDAPEDFDASAQTAYAQMATKTVFSAREALVGMLRESGQLLGDPRPIKHPVKFYEKGDRPLEIVTSSQWYIRNGGRDAPLRDTLLERGKELQWHPAFMRVRYEDWVTGLNGDWLISRQRFFGVSIPLWYRVDDDGEVLRDEVLVPNDDALPIDPSTDVPDGYDESQRGKPGGFVGDPDIMDTWATSSLTPQIAARWMDDKALFDLLFPMSLRPQGPEIIRTWLFDTLLRAHFEHGSLPWQHAYMNGWVLDPDRKKMSKSKGNVITPMGYVDDFGADAFRYWACCASPGTDTAFSVEQIKAGRRLATKILNASKLVLGYSAETEVDLDQVTEYVDRIELARLDAVIEKATASFEKFNYARALEATEQYFWDFCNVYLELTKVRAYGAEGTQPQATQSARVTARYIIDTVVRLFAPHLPFATEEVWGWSHNNLIAEESWPVASGLSVGEAGAAANTAHRVVADVLAKLRGEKSRAQLSMKHGVESLVICADEASLRVLQEAESDLKDAGVIQAVEYVPAEQMELKITLAAADAG